MTEDLNIPIVLNKSGIRFIARMILAYFLVILGICGIILPILPGWPFLIAGVALLDVNGTIRKRVWSWVPAKAQKMVLRWYKKIKKG
jgi:uncharacterized membrane protein YbaN (DUF454 family)